jgi:hypothetical protein
MKKRKKNASLHEALRKKWAIRIMLEKEYSTVDDGQTGKPY